MKKCLICLIHGRRCGFCGEPVCTEAECQLGHYVTVVGKKKIGPGRPVSRCRKRFNGKETS